MSKSLQAPTFEPWVGRVRLARTWAMGLGFVAVTFLSLQSGMAIDDSLLRGLAGALVSFFVGWTSALLICSELHHAKIHRIRRNIELRERERAQILRDIYEQRIQPGSAAAPTTPSHMRDAA